MSSSPASLRARFDTLLTLAFVVALSAPWIDTLVRDVEERGPRREQRPTAPRPSLPTGIYSLSTFPERCEMHFNDTFGLRDHFLRWHSIEHLFAFGVSPTQGMLLGREHWLFYAGDRSIPVYRGMHPFSASEIERWLKTWEERRDFLARRGIAYLFVVAPSKETVYPEHVPARFNKVGPTRREQLFAHLAQRADLPVLDLARALQEEKRNDLDRDYTYVPLGTHWNARGHYAAYRAIAEALHAQYPALRVSERDDVEPVKMKGNGDSWGDRMYIDDLLTQSDAQMRPIGKQPHTLVFDGYMEHRLRVYDGGPDDGPRVVLLHDSFGGNVGDLLGTSCQTLASLQTPDFDVDFIERACPDVVVELYVERIFVSWPAPPAPDDVVTDRRHFERSIRSLDRFDDPRSPAVLRALLPTRLEMSAAVGAPLAVVDASGSDARFELAGLRAPEQGDVVLHARIESPGPASLRIYFRRPDAPDLDRTSFRWALLRAGSNELWFRFRAQELRAPLYCLLGDARGSYVIHELETRAVDTRE